MVWNMAILISKKIPQRSIPQILFLLTLGVLFGRYFPLLLLPHLSWNCGGGDFFFRSLNSHPQGYIVWEDELFLGGGLSFRSARVLPWPTGWTCDILFESINGSHWVLDAQTNNFSAIICGRVDCCSFALFYGCFFGGVLAFVWLRLGCLDIRPVSCVSCHRGCVNLLPW